MKSTTFAKYSEDLSAPLYSFIFQVFFPALLAQSSFPMIQLVDFLVFSRNSWDPCWSRFSSNRNHSTIQITSVNVMKSWVVYKFCNFHLLLIYALLPKHRKIICKTGQVLMSYRFVLNRVMFESGLIFEVRLRTLEDCECPVWVFNDRYSNNENSSTWTPDLSTGKPEYF